MHVDVSQTFKGLNFCRSKIEGKRETALFHKVKNSSSCFVIILRQGRLYFE